MSLPSDISLVIEINDQGITAPYWQKRIKDFIKLNKIIKKTDSNHLKFKLHFTHDANQSHPPCDLIIYCPENDLDLFKGVSHQNSFSGIEWTADLLLKDFSLLIKLAVKNWMKQKNLSQKASIQKSDRHFDRQAKKIISEKYKDSSHYAKIQNTIQEMVRLGEELGNEDLTKTQIQVQFIQTHLKNKQVTILSDDEVWLTPGDKIFFCQFKGQKFYLSLELDQLADGDILKIYFLKNIIKLIESGENSRLVPRLSLFKEVFDNILTPILVIDSTGELILCNHAFSDLGIPVKNLRGQLQSEQVQLGDNNYLIKKNEMFDGPEQFKVFYFIQHQALVTEYKSEMKELAIIASSLAHELNNPIAALKAAEEYLLSSGTLTSEGTEIIDEMVRTTNRCRDLVKTFLGFSKPVLKMGEGNLELVDLKLIWEQTQYLLKIRILELGYRTHFSFELKHRFGYHLQQSHLVMVFYIILSDCLSIFSRQRLLDDTIRVDSDLNFKLIEETDKLVIETDIVKNFREENISKFLKYLLSELRLDLKVENGSLVLDYAPNLFSFN